MSIASLHMTYERLLNLKFLEEVPTHELERRFPKEIKKISHVALLDLPMATLKTLIKRHDDLERLLALKRSFLKQKKNKKK